MVIPSDNGAEPVARRRPTRFSGHLIVLVILSALPFVLLSVGLSMHAAIEERRQMLRDMEDTSGRLQIAIDRELEVTETILRVAALSTFLQQAISAGADGPAEQREGFHVRASELVALRPGLVLNMVLHDRTGRQIVNTLQPLGADLPSVDQTGVPEARAAAEPDLRARAVFEDVVAAGEFHITDLFFGPVAQRYLIAVLLPIERDGEVVAVLSSNLLPSALGDRLREQMTGIGYVASVIDRSGTIIARSFDEDRFIGQLSSPELRGFARDSGLEQLTRRSLTVDGVEVYGAFRKLSVVPWSIAYGAPRSVVDAPIRRLALTMGGAGSLALATFVAVALHQGRRLSDELQTLAADAERLGGGGPLSERVDRVHEVAEVRAALRAGVASLATAEERMRLAVEGSGMATWDIDASRDELVWAGHFLEMLGLPPDQEAPVSVETWLDRVHPDDRTALEVQWQASREQGTRFHSVYRITRADDGVLRWLESYGAHTRDGGQHRFIGVTFDVTERHRAEEHRQLLMREVDHRAKNALAVVHSIVRLTRADDPAGYAAAVEGRGARPHSGARPAGTGPLGRGEPRRGGGSGAGRTDCQRAGGLGRPAGNDRVKGRAADPPQLFFATSWWASAARWLDAGSVQS